jgi:hypothetical protein
MAFHRAGVPRKRDIDQTSAHKCHREPGPTGRAGTRKRNAGLGRNNRSRRAMQVEFGEQAGRQQRLMTRHRGKINPKSE